MIILDLVQGSPEWVKEKLGKPSASNVSKIITNSGEPSKQRQGYMDELAAEIITGEAEEGYKNGIMEMGNERESESRSFYELTNGVEVKTVGVIYKDEAKEFLCSPDGIIYKGKKPLHGLELKNVLGKTQVRRLLDNSLPSEYFGQIQMSLYITGFEFWDWCSYRPKMKPLVVRVPRDEKYIKALSIELEVFTKQLKDTVKRIK